MTAWQKAIKYLAIAFAIFLTVSIISGISGALAGITSVFTGESEDAGEMTEYSVGDGIKMLDIELSAADLEIKVGDRLYAETNHNYISIKDDDGCLEIKESNPSFTNMPKGVKLTLYIPDGKAFTEAEIETGAGRVTIESLYTDRLNLDVGAGDMSAAKLYAVSKAEINGGAGRMIISDGVLNNAKIDMGVGALEFTGRLTGGCSLNCGIGKAALTLYGKSDDYTIRLDKGVGKAYIDGKEAASEETFGSGSNFLDIDGGIGEISIAFEALPQAPKDSLGLFSL